MHTNTSEISNSLLIRDFRKEDMEGFLQCLRESSIKELEIRGFDLNFWRKMYSRRFKLSGRFFFGILRLLHKEPTNLLVAIVDGIVAGGTIVSLNGKIGNVQYVMVHPHFRRKGIGTELMNTTLNYMKKRKLARSVLHVRQGNAPAKGLYRKLGFRKFEEIMHLTAEINSLSIPTTVVTALIRDFDEKTDIDTVYQLMKSSINPLHFDIYDFKKKDLKTSLMERIIQLSTGRRFVAIREGKVIGYIRASYTTAKEAGTIRLYVPSERISEEIVGMLVQAGVNHIKSIGTKTVLTVVPSTYRELIDVLKKLGFEERLSQEGMVLEFQ